MLIPYTKKKKKRGVHMSKISNMSILQENIASGKQQESEQTRYLFGLLFSFFLSAAVMHLAK